jgi:hypothetical protein
MSGTVWDQEFFRRRAAGEQAGHAQEPTGATPFAPGHATIAELLLARAGDDNTALLFEDQRWSWRELVLQAATRSALMQQLRPQEGPWHVGVLLENTPEYIFLIAGAALCGATVVGINPTRRGAELAADIRGTDCAVIVTDDAYGDLLDGTGHGVPQILDASSSGLCGPSRDAPRGGGRGDGGGPRSAVHVAAALHIRIDGSAEGGDLLHRPVGVHMPGQPDQVQPG